MSTALPSSRSSGLLSSSGQVFTGTARLNAVTILTDGTNAATITIYDNTSASGLVLYKGILAGASNSRDSIFISPVRCEIGMYISISGTGANAILHFNG
jgi:hypothetical protein